MKRFRRAKASDAVCRACGRQKGERSKAKCPRCPGQAVGATLVDPLVGVRIVTADPGMERTGLSMLHPRDPRRVEYAISFDPLDAELDHAMACAVRASNEDGAPLWLAIEDPGAGGDWATPEMLLSVGQAIGMVRRAFVRAGGKDNRIALVRQVTWQAGAGVDRKHASREDRIDEAIARAREELGEHTIDGEAITWDPDSACAGMLAWFVVRWPEFIDRLGVREREAAARIAAAGPPPVRPSFNCPECGKAIKDIGAEAYDCECGAFLKRREEAFDGGWTTHDPPVVTRTGAEGQRLREELNGELERRQRSLFG